jgi:hypothetical protein
MECGAEPNMDLENLLYSEIVSTGGQNPNKVTTRKGDSYFNIAQRKGSSCCISRSCGEKTTPVFLISKESIEYDPLMFEGYVRYIDRIRGDTILFVLDKDVSDSGYTENDAALILTSKANAQDFNLGLTVPPSRNILLIGKRDAYVMEFEPVSVGVSLPLLEITESVSRELKNEYGMKYPEATENYYRELQENGFMPRTAI